MKTNSKILTLSYVIFLIVLIVFVVNFLTKDWGVSKRLGDNYIFTSDKSILYQLNDKEYFVLPDGVESVKSDERWIIATTEGLNATFKNCNQKSDNGTQYWIIDKSKPIMNLHSMYKSNIMFIKDNQYPIIASGLIGPLDSLSFSDKIKLLRIKLSIK